jgi:hypothetical protein
MSHLSQKIAEFVFGELSAVEIADAEQHLEGCPACRTEVEAFRRTHLFLKTSTDVEPPRRIVFEVEKRSSVWRWLVPVAAAAALILAAWIALPVDVRWQASQLTIAFGQLPQAVAPAAIVQRDAIVEPVDYDRIIVAVREAQQEWLTNELRTRDVAQKREIERLNGELAYLERMQLVMYRDTIDNAAGIQLLARSQPQE